MPSVLVGGGLSWRLFHRVFGLRGRRALCVVLGVLVLSGGMSGVDGVLGGTVAGAQTESEAAAAAADLELPAVDLRDGDAPDDTAAPVGSGEQPAGLVPERVGSFDESRSVELLDKRTANSKTFDNGDGTLAVRVFQDTVHVPDTAGRMVDIDLNLQGGADGRLRSRQGKDQVDFSAVSNQADVARLVLEGGESVSFGFAGSGAPQAPPAGGVGVLPEDPEGLVVVPPADAAPGDAAAVVPAGVGVAAVPAVGVVAAHVVRYSGVLPDVDLELAAGVSRVKEQIVLHNANTPTTFVFPLTLVGLTASLAADGGVEYRDAAGEVKLLTPHGFMVDSAVDPVTGEPARSGAVSYRLIPFRGGEALEVSIDPVWLADPKRVFPVSVDPTWWPYTSDDTYTRNGHNWDHYTEDELLVGSTIGWDVARSFLNFDLSLFPYSGDAILQARLALVNNWSGTCNSNPRGMGVYTPQSAWWGQDLDVWPGPQPGSLIAYSEFAYGNDLYCGDGDGWAIFDVTSTVKGWENNTVPNNGFMFVAANEGNPEFFKKFWSFEGGSPLNVRPFLEIIYSDGPHVSGLLSAPSGQIDTVTPLFHVQGVDPDNWPQPLGYWYQVGTALLPDGKLDPAFLVADRFWDPNPTFQPPTTGVNALRWGQKYFWTVKVTDGQSIAEALWSGGLPSFTPTPPSAPTPGHLGSDPYATNSGGVNSASGNFTMSVTDASVAVAGPGLGVERTYNSLDGRWGKNRPFGQGWSTNFDMNLDVEDTKRLAYLFWPDGRRETFGIDHTGALATPQGGFYSLLKKISSSVWELTDKNGTVYVFDGGKLSEQRDSNGRRLVYTYSGGLLSTIASDVDLAVGVPADARKLTFTWTAGHVSSVKTSPVGGAGSELEWTYQYSGDSLTKVCDPRSTPGDQFCNQYDYETYGGTNPQPYPSAVLAERPKAYYRLDETTGVDAVDASGNGRTGVYGGTYSQGVGGALYGDTVNKAVATTTGFAVLGNDVVKESTSSSVELWFRTSTAGRPLLGMDNYVPGGPISEIMVPLYVDNTGKLNGGFWTNTGLQHLVSANTVTDGRWHHVVLSSTGYSQALWLDGQLEGERRNIVVNHLSMVRTYAGTGDLSGHPNAPGGWGSWLGDIDEVAVYATPPDPNQIGVRHILGRGRLDTVKQPKVVRSGSGAPIVDLSYEPSTGRVSTRKDGVGNTWGYSFGSGTPDQVLNTAAVGGAAIGYFKLDETTGAFANSAGGCCTGTAAGGVTRGARPAGAPVEHTSLVGGAPAAPAYSVEFDNSNTGEVVIPDTGGVFNTADMTVEAWIFPRNQPAGFTYQMIANKPRGTARPATGSSSA